MKIAPMLFNTDMVQAILDGRKTVTRRLIKLPKNIELQDNGLYTLFDEGKHYKNQHMEDLVDYLKPLYQPGDIIWVQETWKVRDVLKELSMKFEYRADGKVSEFIDFVSERMEKFLKFANKNGWQSPYFMPKEAARLFLRVKDVRVERLNDMTEEDAKKEGAQEKILPITRFKVSALINFIHIWNSIVIKNSDPVLYEWDANPWVFVFEFEQCEKPAEF